jgi:hypothetical protein
MQKGHDATSGESNDKPPVMFLPQPTDVVSGATQGEGFPGDIVNVEPVEAHTPPPSPSPPPAPPTS